METIMLYSLSVMIEKRTLSIHICYMTISIHLRAQFFCRRSSQRGRFPLLSPLRTVPAQTNQSFAGRFALFIPCFLGKALSTLPSLSLRRAVPTSPTAHSLPHDSHNAHSARLRAATNVLPPTRRKQPTA